jgi:hypothetical protein
MELEWIRYSLPVSRRLLLKKNMSFRAKLKKCYPRQPWEQINMCLGKK